MKKLSGKILWFRQVVLPAGKQLSGVVFGALVTAVSINVFILPNGIADAGITGISLMLYYLFQWDVGPMIFLFNLPLFVLGYFLIGRKLLIFSVIGVGLLSVFLQLLQGILQPITDDLLLAAVFGGLITGLGTGIILRSHGSLGGTDIIALILNRRTPFSVGQIILGIDIVILVGAAVVFTPKMAMYAMIYMYVVTKVIDLIQGGVNYSKCVMVMTEKPEEISREIINTLGRGVTFLDAEGAFYHQEKKVVYSVVNRTQLASLKEIVRKHDAKAFLVVSDVSEVFGEGFTGWKGH